MKANPENTERRRFLTATAAVVGGVGLAVATVPFIASMQPSERARVEGGPLRVEIGKIRPGMQITLKWRGKPVWILKRDEAMLKRLDNPDLERRLADPDSDVETQQPKYAQNTYRSIRPDTWVAIGICTHLGCVPTYRPELAPADLGPEWPGGYFCPCHGSRFDLAGRVYKGVPAPTNLEIPSYRYVSDTEVEIGVDSDEPIEAKGVIYK